MKFLKVELTKLILLLYNNSFKRNFIRKGIKKMLSSNRIDVSYKGIKLQLGINTSIETSILFNEYNEDYILEMIKYFSKLDYNFIDIGANIGVHSILAAASNKNIEVFAFEPAPENILNFIKNQSLNNLTNIRFFSSGIGSKNDGLKLHLNDGWNKGKHSIKIKRKENANFIYIPILSLDSFVGYFEKNSKTPIILKIDVEGFEYEVLSGSINFIETFDNIILIIELIAEINGIESCEKIFNLLKFKGFSNSFMLFNQKTLLKSENYTQSGDYIFIKGIKPLNEINKFIKE